MAEPDELAPHAPVPPRRVLRRHPDHELADRGWRGRAGRDTAGWCDPICGRPAAGARPAASPGSPRTPRSRRRRGISRDSAESQSRSHGWGEPADLAAQHRVLVPQYQEFGILGHLTPGQHHHTAQEAAREQVDNRADHSAMIPTRQAAQVRSSNRAPQGRRHPRGPVGPYPAGPAGDGGLGHVLGADTPGRGDLPGRARGSRPGVITLAGIWGLVDALATAWCWPPAWAWSREGSPWPTGPWQDFGLRQEGRAPGCPVTKAARGGRGHARPCVEATGGRTPHRRSRA